MDCYAAIKYYNYYDYEGLGITWENVYCNVK